MKKIFIVLIASILSAYSGVGNILAVSPLFTQVYPTITILQDPNGWVTKSPESYPWAPNTFFTATTYKSHDPDYTYLRDCEDWYCKKTEEKYENTPWTKGRVTLHDFILTINDLNYDDPPEWIIIFQDWAQIDINDTDGYHPITTLKIKFDTVNNKSWLTHYDNSWQFNYSVANPVDPTDETDKNHNHQADTKHYSVVQGPGFSRYIQITIYDGQTPTDGRVTMADSGEIFSDFRYQTKQTENRHFTAWGMYWNKDYNTRINNCTIAHSAQSEMECKSNSITISNMKIYERFD